MRDRLPFIHIADLEVAIRLEARSIRRATLQGVLKLGLIRLLSTDAMRGKRVQLDDETCWRVIASDTELDRPVHL